VLPVASADTLGGIKVGEGLSINDGVLSVGSGDERTSDVVDIGCADYMIVKGGGSELPEVTADDNGDVLTVVNGAWAKAAPGGGGALVVTVNEETGALDKTWQEINDAMPLVYVHIGFMYG